MQRPDLLIQYQIKTEPVFVPPPAFFFQPLADPVRFRTLGAHLQKFFTWHTFIFVPATPLDSYYVPFTDPVRLKPGLKSPYQLFYAAPTRLLPTPDVTVTMAAIEVNSDIFLGAINVYDSGGSAASNQGAKVSISEIEVPASSGMSIRES